MELFKLQGKGAPPEAEAQAPLAWRMRPGTLDEFVGQKHILDRGKLLWRIIKANRPFSLILYGPPGCGKTALAWVVSRELDARFFHLNAVTAGVADLKKVQAEAQAQRRQGKRSILFLDEIHRFNRAQQDVLLPMVETGLIYLIGASTYNPFFAIIPPLASRSTLIRFTPLSTDDLNILIDRALADRERGMGGLGVSLDDEARRYLLSRSGGDARKLLNALEIAALSVEPSGGERRVSLAIAEESLQEKALAYDEDAHYDTISAFIKSMRGTDPDATLFWLAKMIEAGEDPLFIARRIVICAAEDVGLAEPMALVVAQAAHDALTQVGMPEGRIPLAEAAVFVACAPKSNAAYMGLERATADIRAGRPADVPAHLKDASYRGAEKLGHGKGYKYPHEYAGHFVPQSYMLHEAEYYTPSDQGHEADIGRRLKLRERKSGKKRD